MQDVSSMPSNATTAADPRCFMASALCPQALHSKKSQFLYQTGASVTAYTLLLFEPKRLFSDCFLAQKIDSKDHIYEREQ